MKIYLDFDGTVVEHKYPKIGRAVPGWLQVVKKLLEAGHPVLLNTYRADMCNGSLLSAVEYLSDVGISVNARVQKKHPPVWDWHLMRETGEIYIDDSAADMPLTTGEDGGKVVDWQRVHLEFIENGIYED